VVEHGVESVLVEMAVEVEHARVRPMFRFVDAAHVYTEPRVREPVVTESGGVGEEDGNEQGTDGEDDAEA
jgi:hypothetical protein